MEFPATLKNHVNVLVCPTCGGGLAQTNDALFCAPCNANYPVRNGKIYFVAPPPHKTTASDIKHGLRRLLGNKYNKAVRILGPGFPINKKKLLFESIDNQAGLVVDLGSGTERIAPGIVTLDLFDYPDVDVVCDLRSLPFKEGSVDAFMTTSVLEHVPDPAGLIDKMFFCTKVGGIGIHSFPFLFPFHESPGDFTRYTHAGARILFSKWGVRRLFNVTGPITAFNLITAEFMSTGLSFGNGRIKEALYLAIGALLSPIKYLDFPFVDNARFLSVSAMLCAVVEKPSRN